MDAPKAITDTIAALQSERGSLASRLDAIDLVLLNLSLAYGLRDTPARLRIEPDKVKPVTSAAPVHQSGDASAADRCAALLAVIGRSENGATIAELRKATPKMDGTDRSNSLYTLKVKGKIRRAGNTWVKAA